MRNRVQLRSDDLEESPGSQLAANAFEPVQALLDLYGPVERQSVSVGDALPAFRADVSFIDDDGSLTMRLHTSKSGLNRGEQRLGSFGGVSVFVDPGDERRVAEVWQTALAVDGPFEADCRLVTRSQMSQWFRLAGVPEARKDGSRYWSTSCICIDDLKREQQHLRDDSVQIRRTMINQRFVGLRWRDSHLGFAASSGAQKLSELASTLAHELRQPITAAMAYASAASRTLKLPHTSQRRAIAAIATQEAVDQLMRAGEIIRSMRGLIISGECHREWNDLLLVVEQAVDFALAGNAKVKVTIRSGSSPGQPVFFNEVQISQVVTNILRNAIEAMQSMRDARIEVSVDYVPMGGIEVSIRDSGPGISREAANRLFVSGVTTKPDGMGLGLLICRTIIEEHGGKIWTEAGEPQGTTIKFSLPATQDDDARIL